MTDPASDSKITRVVRSTFLAVAASAISAGGSCDVEERAS